MPLPSNYHLVFSDEFNGLSIADTTNATANWYTAQAWGGGFGDAQVMKISTNRSPFSTVVRGGETALQIEMTRNAAGKLESGLISNVFPDGTSTTPHDGNPYGYYETRLWLPKGQGIWPAFWAMELERLSPTRDHVFELDVLEHHGTDAADRYGSNMHDWNWNGNKLTSHVAQPSQNIVGNDVLGTGWHTYGIEIRPDLTAFYMDGSAYSTRATPDKLDTDLMFMINLAAGGGWTVDPELNHVKMYIDYFRAYELDSPQSVATSAIILTGTGTNDTFTVDAETTEVREAANRGFDTVRSSVTYTLDANVEKLLLKEGAARDGTGNDSGNQLYGNTAGNLLLGLGGNDYVYGQDGNDMLVGGIGNDKLYGGNGNDRLIGEGGVDRLQGDAGADTFLFQAVLDSSPNAQDSIVDFSSAAGDRINLQAIDANTLVAGDQAFTWIGSVSFTQAGQLRLEKGVLSADVNDDHIADFAVTIGTVTMQHDDFIL